MLLYITKYLCCSLLFHLIYIVFLEKQGNHRFKRIYLLTTLVLAAVIPLLTITTYTTPEAIPQEEINEAITNQIVIEDDTALTKSNLIKLSWLLLIITSYGIGSLLFCYRFVKNLITMYRAITQNSKLTTAEHIKVLVLETIVPHTFLKYIFVNKTAYLDHQIPEQVLLHENAHVRQKHSWDILFAEFIHILFWFNPIIHFTKKSIRLNHEFLADQAVLSNGIDAKTYQNMLLEFSSNSDNHSLANAINYSSIKKRIVIMKTKTSKKSLVLRSLMIIPLVCLIGYGFSTKETIIEEPSTQQYVGILVTQPTDTLTSKAKYYKNATFYVKNIDGTKTKKTYQELTIQQQQNLWLPKVPVKKSPSEALLKQWAANPSTYGIWIDNKQISNTELNNYTPADFALYGSSKLEKNAKNYGKHKIQVDLTSHARYDALYGNGIQPLTSNARITINASQQDPVKIYKKKNNAYEKLRKGKPHYVKKSAKEQKELDDLYSEIASLFFKLSSQNKTKVSRPTTPFYPYVRVETNGKINYYEKDEWETVERNLIPLPPPPPAAPSAPEAPEVIEVIEEPIAPPPPPVPVEPVKPN